MRLGLASAQEKPNTFSAFYPTATASRNGASMDAIDLRAAGAARRSIAFDRVWLGSDSLKTGFPHWQDRPAAVRESGDAASPASSAEEAMGVSSGRQESALRRACRRCTGCRNFFAASARETTGAKSDTKCPRRCRRDCATDWDTASHSRRHSSRGRTNCRLGRAGRSGRATPAPPPRQGKSIYRASSWCPRILR